MLDRVGHESRPEVALRRARVCWRSGDPEGARAAVDAGLALAAGTHTAVEVELRIEQLRAPIRVDFDGERALWLGTETLDLARSLGIGEARASTLLGSAHLVAATGDWERHITAGLRLAQRDHDLDAELEAANALVAAHLLGGDRHVARASPPTPPRPDRRRIAGTGRSSSA